MRMCTLALAVLGLGGTSLGQPAPQDPLLRSRLALLSRAFRTGDPGLLRRSLGPSGRIRLDLPERREAQGNFGPGQVAVVLSLDFRDVTVSGSDSAHARGQWVRRINGAAERETLLVTLQLDGGDWRIVEIRSTP
jgi:hypothetical protein